MTSAEGEQALLAAALAGSPRAYAEIVRRHQQTVRAFLRRTCRDMSEADDLAQETFVTAWRRLGDFRGEASLRVWLCGIAYRKALTHRRGLLRRLRREQPDPAEAASLPSGASEARLDLARGMRALSPPQRAVVALCLGADFSHDEAAKALDMPVGTVKSHLARGRERLRLALEPDDGRR